MFPITIDVVAADHSRRLESVSTESGGRSRPGPMSAVADLHGRADGDRPALRHRAWHRPALTR